MNHITVSIIIIFIFKNITCIPRSQTLALYKKLSDLDKSNKVFSPVTAYLILLEIANNSKTRCLRNLLECLGEQFNEAVFPKYTSTAGTDTYDPSKVANFNNIVFGSALPYDFLSNQERAETKIKNIFFSDCRNISQKGYSYDRHDNSAEINNIIRYENNDPKTATKIESGTISEELKKTSFKLLKVDSDSIGETVIDIALAISVVFYSTENFNAFQHGESVAYKPSSPQKFVSVPFDSDSSGGRSKENDGVWLMELPADSIQSTPAVAGKAGAGRKVYIGVTFYDKKDSFFVQLTCQDYLTAIIEEFSKNKGGEYEAIKKSYESAKSANWPDHFFLPTSYTRTVKKWDSELKNVLEADYGDNSLSIKCPGKPFKYIDENGESRQILDPQANNFYSENVFKISDKGIYMASFFSESFTLKQETTQELKFNGQGMFMCAFLEAKNGPEILFIIKSEDQGSEVNPLKPIYNDNKAILDWTFKIFCIVCFSYLIVAGVRAYSGKYSSLGAALPFYTEAKAFIGWIKGKKARYVVRNHGIREEKFLS